MTKSSDTGSVPRPGDKIHIPLPEEEAIRLALQVKPTKDMPRPGATGKKTIKATHAKRPQSPKTS